MDKKFVIFDFYGNGKYEYMNFEVVEIDGVEIKEYYDVNRLGFNPGNNSLNFPICNISMVKSFTEKEVRMIEDFFFHYLVFPDLPLEFRIRINDLEYINIHGFLENIDFSQDTNNNIIIMTLKATSYTGDF